MGQLVDHLGIALLSSPEETKEVLAQALPQVVDKVTPNGQIPDQAQLDDMLGQLFGQKWRRLRGAQSCKTSPASDAAVEATHLDKTCRGLR